MKTCLPILLSLALWPFTSAHAQWQVIDPQLPDSLDFIAWGISVVDENVVWGNPLRNIAPQMPENKYFYKTSDGGQTWTFGEIEGAAPGWWLNSDLVAIDANTAWVTRVKLPEQFISEILKTIDGGDNWTHQTLPIDTIGITGIHFFNENEGAVWGEVSDGTYGGNELGYPEGWHIGCFYTQNGGDTWLPATVPPHIDEGTPTVHGGDGSYEVLGDNIWFGSVHGRVFYSKDRGHSWSISDYLEPVHPINHLSFRDSLNGIAFSYVDTSFNTTSGKAVWHTRDGGQTWNYLPPANSSWSGWLTDTEYVPGSGGAYWGISQTQTVLSTDNGNSWKHQETPYLLWYTEFLSPNVGWGAGAFHPTPPTSKLFMYKWMGDSILRDEEKNHIETVAGDGLEGHIDGSPTSARFWNPKGMAIDYDGKVYVADDYNHCIRTIAFNGAISTLAGDGTPGYTNGTGASAQFNRPQDVVLDAAGNLYVADANNHVIRKIAPDGTVSLFAGTPVVSGEADGSALQATFSRPSALGIDEAGNLYVSGSHTIRKIDLSGMVSTIHAAAGTIWGLDADRYGNVYFSDSSTLKVQKLTPGGTVIDLAGSGSGCIDGVGTAAQFGSVEDLDADNLGNVYVADGINGRVRKIDTDGKVSTLLGNDCLNGYGLDQQPADGPGNLARLGRVRGILLKPSENLLVTAWDNDMVREIYLGSLPAKPVMAISSFISPLYKSVPLAQTQPLSFSGVVLNYGSENFSELINVRVLKDGAMVWNKNSAGVSIPPGAADTISNIPTFQPTETGAYEVIMNYFFTQYKFRETFIVSDSILAADDGYPFLYENLESSLPDGTASYGQVFEIPVPDTLSGFSMNAQLEEVSFYFSVYAVNGDEPGALLYRSDTVVGASNEYPFDYYYRLPLSFAIPAGKYLFSVTQWTPGGSFGMGVDTDRNDRSAWYLSPDEGIDEWTPSYTFWGEETAPVYMLRPAFGQPGETVSQTTEAALTGLPVQIAPNPAGDQLYVKIEVASAEHFALQLVDMSGKVIRLASAPGGVWTVLDLSGRPAGMYMLRVLGEEKMEVRKVVKQ